MMDFTQPETDEEYINKRYQKQDVKPQFETLLDFTCAYDVQFDTECDAIADELVDILNTGVIQPQHMNSFWHLECLAFYYERINHDYVKAAEYFELAHTHGSPHAMQSLGMLYTRRIKDFELAKKSYLLAMSCGNQKAVIEYAYLCIVQLNDTETGIRLLSDFIENTEYTLENRSLAANTLSNIYYTQNNGKLTIKCLKMAADELNCGCAMSKIYRLVNEYDPVIYDDDVFPNAVEEADKYITKALAMQNHCAFELYIRYKVERANTWINKHKKCIIPQDILDSFVEYGRGIPHWITGLDTPATQQAWTYVSCKLGIPCNNSVAVRINKLSKMAVCDICMSECEKQCIPVNWCMHYACVECYWQLADMPCPFCRCD